MKPRLSRILLCATLAGVPLWQAAGQPRQAPLTPEEIKALGRELQEKQRERERLHDRKELIPLVDLPALPEFQSDPHFAYLRLTNQMDALRAVWTLLPAPAAGEKPEPIVAPLIFRGDQWLRLEPGPWLIQLESGSPDSDLALTMAPRAIELKAGRAYALEMDESTEQQLRKVLARMAAPAPGEATPATEAEATPAP